MATNPSKYLLTIFALLILTVAIVDSNYIWACDILCGDYIGTMGRSSIPHRGDWNSGSNLGSRPPPPRPRPGYYPPRPHHGNFYK
ncbi:unnamed protein product [Orchesella dallaii]|uniref:Uncharacterized protein n=1 Tax=Orchesella dallaii TaxID=48710 RepID=A0ABP1R6S8_9HEXA